MIGSIGTNSEARLIAHAETRIDPYELRIFKRIRTSILLLPDAVNLGQMPDGEEIELSCHMLARTVARLWEFQVEDGSYLHGFDHSWVVTPKGNIIDVYPVAMVSGAIMIDGSARTLVKQLYRADSPQGVERRYGVMFGSTWFKNAVDILSSSLSLQKAALPPL